ncbi:GPR1/FUN34/yaaH family, putative [Angomonas deanei]|uniref:GPR1/FUN34/yaaH family, putative n=1 Tax=Angomonas deanei TaxID=59799 RepID=A0A7G2CT93_9TRYP|nr:GPR1/FUN34/yaaH family, putative [Angomonas deanei]
MTTMGMVVWYGGLTQFIAGFFELINKNTHGCTISTTYGAFWLATAVLFLEPTNESVTTLGDSFFSGGYFLMWFLFALTLFFCSFRGPLVVILLMFLVPLNFLLQSIGYFTGNYTLTVFAGYEGIVVGCVASYIGLAMSFEVVYGRRYLPLFAHQKFKNIKW